MKEKTWENIAKLWKWKSKKLEATWKERNITKPNNFINDSIENFTIILSLFWSRNKDLFYFLSQFALHLGHPSLFNDNVTQKSDQLLNWSVWVVPEMKEQRRSRWWWRTERGKGKSKWICLRCLRRVGYLGENGSGWASQVFCLGVIF